MQGSQQESQAARQGRQPGRRQPNQVGRQQAGQPARYAPSQPARQPHKPLDTSTSVAALASSCGSKCIFLPTLLSQAMTKKAKWTPKIWKGGIIQQMQKKVPGHGSAASSSQEPSSAFKTQLMHQLVANELSASCVQRMAEAAEASGVVGLARLASSGSAGWNPKNTSKDLAKAAGLDRSPVPVYWLDVPLWDSSTGKLQDTSLPMLLPHEVLQLYLELHPSVQPIPGPTSTCRHHFEWCYRAIGCHPDKTIPLSVWADGVPYTKKLSLFMLNLGFPGWPEGDRLPLFLVSSKFLCKCGCGGKHSLDVVYQVLLWSFRYGALGQFPPTRHNMAAFGTSDASRMTQAGQPMASKFLLFQLKGDWDALANYFGLPNWSGFRPCWLCSATKQTFLQLLTSDLGNVALHQQFILLGQGLRTGSQCLCSLALQLALGQCASIGCTLSTWGWAKTSWVVYCPLCCKTSLGRHRQHALPSSGPSSRPTTRACSQAPAWAPWLWA